MSFSSVYYRVRPMRLSDIPAVTEIEHEAFTTPWAPGTYAREIHSTEYSHMIVVERMEQIRSLNRFHALWRHIAGRAAPYSTLLGYGGMWLFGTDAHISTIASHPRYRGQGWGELTLLCMLRRARVLKARRVTLEVRVSNSRAQQLYSKYGFVVVGVKKRYYTDNREDAYEMRAALVGDDHKQFLEARFRSYTGRLTLHDTFTNAPRPSVV